MEDTYNMHAIVHIPSPDGHRPSEPNANSSIDRVPKVLAACTHSAQQFHIRRSMFDGQPGPARRERNVANILIVDDDPAVQATIRLLLERGAMT
jgi:hypothetical protein